MTIRDPDSSLADATMGALTLNRAQFRMRCLVPGDSGCRLYGAWVIADVVQSE